MKIRGIYLKNFRGYQDKKIVIDQDLTVIVGKNDAGKSTILEAINIFLNGGTVKIDKDDINVNSSCQEIIIGLSFELSEDEKRLTIDDAIETNLEEEMLLNKEGFLELHKKYDLSKKTLKPTLLINAYYLSNIEIPLITMKQGELQKKYKELPIEYHIATDERENMQLRQAIHHYYMVSDDSRSERIIEFPNTASYKFRAEHIEEILPSFYLFQADKRNVDSEKDVQDPLKAIIREAGQAYFQAISILSTRIQEQVQQLLLSTKEKMRDFDEEIAEEIDPIVEKKELDSLFSVSFNTSDNIPIFKRGSGFRRLLMLSYFRAIAEGHEAAATNLDHPKTIIYGVEEPENSQHPCNQKMIFSTFINIAAQKNKQVFLTSHTPAIAHYIQSNELILVNKVNGNIEINYGTENETINKIIETLGIHPNFVEKVLWCVESQNDKEFLIRINKNVQELNDIINLDELMKNNQLVIFPMNGSLLQGFIKNDHLKGTSILEFHLYDHDVQEYINLIEQINCEKDTRRKGKNTKRKKMELYCHPDLVKDYFSDELSVSNRDWESIRYRWLTGDDSFDPIDWLFQQGVRRSVPICNDDGKKRKDSIKGTLNKTISRKMTKEMMDEMGTFEEIAGWFIEIKDLCNRALA